VTVNDNVKGLTVGCVQQVNPWQNTWPNGIGTLPQQGGYLTVSTVPTQCSGDYHVFACEHADKCKCGKANRTPEPKKCGACGK